MEHYLKGWQEALLILREDSSVRSFSYWDGRLDASNLVKKKIWIKNPEVKGGGFFQERQVSSKVNIPKQKLKAKEKKIPKTKSVPFVHPSQMPELSPVLPYTPHPNPQVEKQLQAFAEQHSLDRTETLAMIDPVTGRLIDKTTDNNETSVSHSKKMANKTNMVTIHNHPTIATFKERPFLSGDAKLTKKQIKNGQYPDCLNGVAFSREDIRTALLTDESEAHVTTPAYHYVMKLPKPDSAMLQSYNLILEEESKIRAKMEQLKGSRPFLPFKEDIRDYYYSQRQKYEDEYKEAYDEYMEIDEPSEEDDAEIDKKYKQFDLLFDKSREDEKREIDNPSFTEDEKELEAYYRQFKQLEEAKEIMINRGVNGYSDYSFLYKLEDAIDNAVTDINTLLIPRLKRTYGDDNIETQVKGGVIYNFDYWHEVMTRVADQLGFEYKKMKRNNVPEAKIKQQLIKLYGDSK